MERMVKMSIISNLTDGMIVCEGRSNEMKKSIAVVILGSALMLPNNNVEASYSTNEVNSLQAKTVQCLTWEGKQNFNTYEDLRGYLNVYLKELAKQNGHQVSPSKPVIKPTPIQPSKPVVKPTPIEPSKPVVKPTPIEPSTPVIKPTPIQPSTPVVKPTPIEPSTPVIKPTPIQPSTPVVKPTPIEPSTPVVKPTPIQPSTPVVKPTPIQPSTPVEKPADPQTNGSVSAIEQQVLTLTNAERAKASLKPLQIDSKLQASARAKSADMAAKKYFSHTSPTYGSPFDQMKANGITYKAAAENIAMGQRTAQEVVKAWMESPGHRENIMTPGYTHIGIGFDQNGNYWTQQFIQK